MLQLILPNIMKHEYSNTCSLHVLPSHWAARCSSSCLWHNPVRARDLIWWHYLRTCDESETDGRWWQRQRLRCGTGGFSCQSLRVVHMGKVGLSSQLKTERSISHYSRKMTLLASAAQGRRCGIFSDEKRKMSSMGHNGELDCSSENPTCVFYF